MSKWVQLSEQFVCFLAKPRKMRLNDFPNDIILHSRVTVNNLIAERNHIAYLSDSFSIRWEMT